MTMEKPSESTIESIPKLAVLLLPPFGATALLWLTSPNEISAWQGLAALILLGLPWWTFLKWRNSPQEEIPLFPMVALVYSIYFALPLFWGDRNGVGLGAGEPLSGGIISRVLIMVLFGILSLRLGMKSRIGRRISPKNPIDIPDDSKRWDYLRALLVISSLFSLNESAPYLFGEGGRQMIIIFQSIVPMVIFAVLFRNYLRGKASQFDKVLLISFSAIRILTGISSGWLGSLALFGLICMVVYIRERRRIPGFVIALVIVYVLFFQVGKNTFRQIYWHGEAEGSKIDRIAFWVGASLNAWEAALNEPDEGVLRGLISQSLARVSLLKQSANVMELTPSTVPYQYGRLYSYLGVTFIPRFLWPGKPSVSDANRFYQVAYGMTSEENLDKVAIGVGSLTESYINFGWLGVLTIMFLLGIFFDFFQKTFLSQSSGALLGAVGVVLLPKFLIIESQLAAFLGGLAQQVLFVLVVLAPLVYLQRSRTEIENVKPRADTA